MNIAPHIFVLSVFLSVTWGLYLAYTIRDYRRSSKLHVLKQGELISVFRRMVVVFCLWLICFSYVFRTGAVLLGVDDALVGQIVFFALIGSNVVGSLFAVVSLRYDD